MTIDFHPLAIEEAREARLWYEERAILLGESFMKELDHAVDQILELPSAWPQFEGNTRRYLMHRFPYFLIYRIKETEIEIVAVMHCKRRPGYWHGR